MTVFGQSLHNTILQEHPFDNDLDIDYQVSFCVNIKEPMLNGTRLYVEIEDTDGYKEMLGIYELEGLPIGEWSPPQNPMFTKYMFNSIRFFVGSDYPDDGTVESLSKVGIDNICINFVEETSIVSNRNIVFDESINLYPNPVNNTFTLEFSNTLVNDIDLQIVGIMGQKLRKEHLSKGKNSYQFDVSSLPSAVYLIKLLGANGQVWYSKFVKY